MNLKRRISSLLLNKLIVSCQGRILNRSFYFVNTFQTMDIYFKEWPFRCNLLLFISSLFACLFIVLFCFHYCSSSCSFPRLADWLILDRSRYIKRCNCISSYVTSQYRIGRQREKMIEREKRKIQQQKCQPKRNKKKV